MSRLASFGHAYDPNRRQDFDPAFVRMLADAQPHTMTSRKRP